MAKLVPLEQLAELGRHLREDGRRLVVTNGHFDLLHVGHVRYLQEARRLGDALLVGINDDAMTRLRKGEGRPLVPADERAELVAALACVDYVCIFASPTAEELVRLAHPTVYAKGGDYRDADGGLSRLPESTIAGDVGAEIVLLPLTAGRSTSQLIERIVTRYAGRS